MESVVGKTGNNDKARGKINRNPQEKVGECVEGSAVVNKILENK
jgi:hypothetical protein